LDPKKVLPMVLVASLAGEAVLPVRQSNGLAPQPHIELRIKVPSGTVATPASETGAGGNVTSNTIVQNFVYRIGI
jgi:hypothetical protein